MSSTQQKIPDNFEFEKHLYYKKIINPETERLKNHIFVRTNSYVEKVVAFSIDLILNKKFPNVVLSAVSKNMDKAVFIAELIKRKLKGVSQQTSLGILEFKEVYVPKKKTPERWEFLMDRNATVLSIILDYRDTIDITHYGYQRPLPLNLVSTKNPRDYVLMIINQSKNQNKKYRNKYKNKNDNDNVYRPRKRRVQYDNKKFKKEYTKVKVKKNSNRWDCPEKSEPTKDKKIEKIDSEEKKKPLEEDIQKIDKIENDDKSYEQKKDNKNKKKTKQGKQYNDDRYYDDDKGYKNDSHHKKGRYYDDDKYYKNDSHHKKDRYYDDDKYYKNDRYYDDDKYNKNDRNYKKDQYYDNDRYYDDDRNSKRDRYYDDDKYYDNGRYYDDDRYYDNQERERSSKKNNKNRRNKKKSGNKNSKNDNNNHKNKPVQGKTQDKQSSN